MPSVGKPLQRGLTRLRRLPRRVVAAGGALVFPDGGADAARHWRENQRRPSCRGPLGRPENRRENSRGTITQGAWTP